MSKRLSKMGWILLAALLCLALVALPACTAAPTGEEEEEQAGVPYKNPGIFVEQTIGDVDSFDPAWAYDTASGEQFTYIYETLMAYDGGSTSKYVPVLCRPAYHQRQRISLTISVRASNSQMATP